MIDFLKDLWSRISSIFEHDISAEIKERVNNPFFISLILNWCAWNWKLVFVFFNFDSDFKVGDKIFLISSYLVKHHSWDLVWGPILTALASIVLLGLINQAALVINVFYRRKLQPLVYKMVGHKDIVDIATHKEVRDRLLRIQEAYDEIEEERSSAVSENQEVNAQYRKTLGLNEELNRQLNVAKSDIQKANLKTNASDMFDGNWVCKYVNQEGESGVESISIKDKKYYVNGVPRFTLDMVDVNKAEKTFKFRKYDSKNKDTETLVNDLKIVNSNIYHGIEGGNGIATYIRIGKDLPYLSFKPSFTQKRIVIGDSSNLIFNFFNESALPLEILSYRMTCYFNGARFSQHNENSLIRKIQPANVMDERFNSVDPIQYYFNNNSQVGTYDAELNLKYKIDGPNDEAVFETIGVARLIVMPQDAVQSAFYGAGGNTINVTNRVNELIRKRTPIHVINSVLLSGADPAPGQVKTLRIEATIKGQKTIYALLEGSIISIPE